MADEHPGIRLPHDWELIGFFEVEPVLTHEGDADYGWQYNELTFSTKRGDDEISCIMSPSHGKLSINWSRSGVELIDLKTAFAERLRVQKEGDREYMTVDYLESTKLCELILQLKPNVHLSWGVSRWER